MNKRQEILEAAFDMLATDGLESVHARTVAGRVGVNHAAVHYYFRTREDLLLAVFALLKERFEADRERFLATASSPAGRVEALVLQGEAYCKPNSRLIRALSGLLAASRGIPSLKTALEEFVATWAKGLKKEIDAARGTGGVRADSQFADGDSLLAAILGAGLIAQVRENNRFAAKHFDRVVNDLMA